MRGVYWSPYKIDSLHLISLLLQRTGCFRMSFYICRVNLVLCYVIISIMISHTSLRRPKYILSGHASFRSCQILLICSQIIYWISWIGIFHWITLHKLMKRIATCYPKYLIFFYPLKRNFQNMSVKMSSFFFL